MCGIVGYVQPFPAPPGTLARMTDGVAHRGPDGTGVWESATPQGWHAALGHRRLAIIDPKGGHQPFATNDGDLQLSYNGEIYNCDPLRSALRGLGHRFETRCDTEVVARHLEENGSAGIVDLDGIFAFAFWDQTIGRLLLARDRVGVKPLFYSLLPGRGIAFASELMALLQHPGVSRSIDPDALANYFFRDYVPAPATMFQNVFKLQPGHFLTWDIPQPRPTLRSYWVPPTPRTEAHRSDRSLSDQLFELLDTSVSSQLVADVPLGVFLSGGIDSSAIAAIARKHVGEGLSTFSIAFDDPDFDESHFARRVANHIGSHHVELTLNEEKMLAALEPALGCWDEPVGDPSILPTFLLSKLAAEHVKVTLGGDGADELWGGYPTYAAHRYATHYARIPKKIRDHVFRPLISKLPVRDGYQSWDWKMKRFALRWEDDESDRHERWMSNIDLPELHRAMPKSNVRRAGSVQLAGGDRKRGLFDRILLHDFTGYLPGSVLAKVDRASMANGLEVRTPMLSNALIDFAFSIPALQRVTGGTKHLLKEAVQGLLPREILTRPKRGFAVPLARWLDGALRPHIEGVLRDSPIWDLPLINRAPFAEWLSEHQERTADHSKPLWSLFVLHRWMRQVAS